MIKSTASVAAAVALFAGSAAAQAVAGQWGQCGGQGWTGPTACPAGWSCQSNGNAYYSQCLQGAASTPSKVTTSSTAKPAVPATSTKAAVTTTKPAVSTTKPASTSIAPATTSAAAPAPAAPASGFLAGVNLAGLEFGCEVWGWCSGGAQSPPLDQIAHFAAQGVNSFRIPFGWQYMTPTIGGALDAGFFSKYDAVVQAALKASTAPYVILDLHNYGRVQSGVVGKDGPSNAAFASLWGALAQKYASNSKIIFGLMNEPHDMDINAFKNSLQEAVNAIRAAGAKTQMILLPGTDWTHASSFLSTNKAALSTITDPAGGKALLVYDFHQYLDSDGSGTNRECVTDRADLWAPIAADLRKDGRKAMITEIGGASTDSCIKYLKSALTLIKANSDVYSGVNVWSAGAFNQGYELSVTPAGSVDTPIWAQAVRPALLGSGGKAKRHEKARLAQH